MNGWDGRVDRKDGDAGLRWHQVVAPYEPGLTKSVVFLGLASDEGVRRNQGRTGAAEGPGALRRMLSNLPVHDPVLLYDAGDVACSNGDLEGAQQRYAKLGAAAVRGGNLLIGLGGGHEIAFASYSALEQSGFIDGRRVGILNFDAHFDLRMDDQPTSGTPFRQALDQAQARDHTLSYRVMGISKAANTRALFETASSRGVQFVLDSDLTWPSLETQAAALREWLATLDHVYLTICLDVLPASVAPGVSAPAARGVSFEILEFMVGIAAQSGKIRVADVAELNPSLDIDNRTARTAARLLWTIIEAAKPR